MIKLVIDTAQLRRTIAKAAKLIGETGRESTARWGVQSCREMSKMTQPFGGGKAQKGYEKGTGAIYKDARNVLIVVDGELKKGRRSLRSPQEVYDWIEINRTRRRGRTAVLSDGDKKICTRDTFMAACRMRIAKVGIAKGGWIDAGRAIAAANSGIKSIGIGRDWVPWAQKQADKRQLGTGRMIGGKAHPVAEGNSLVSYSGDPNILSKAKASRAIFDAGKTVLKVYEKRLQRSLNKK